MEKASITLTFKQLITSAVSLILVGCGAFWVVFSFTMGGMQSDFASIRTSVDNLQKADTETIKGAATMELDMRRELSDLTAQLKVTTATLENLSGSISGLDGSIKAVDAKPGS